MLEIIQDEAEASAEDDAADADLKLAQVEPELEVVHDVSSWPTVVLQNYVVLICIHALQRA